MNIIVGSNHVVHFLQYSFHLNMDDQWILNNIAGFVFRELSGNATTYYTQEGGPHGQQYAFVSSAEITQLFTELCLYGCRTRKHSEG